MSKIILNLAISLDGYIARLDNEVDFLDDIEADENKDLGIVFNEFLEGVDTVVMGSTSYEQMLKLGPNSFSNKKMYVLTSQEYVEQEGVTFTDIEIADLAIQMKSESKSNVWLFGGAKVIKQFIALDLVDEFIITIIPIIIGAGIPLFLFTNEDRELELIESKTFGSKVMLHYRRKSK